MSRCINKDIWFTDYKIPTILTLIGSISNFMIYFIYKISFPLNMSHKVYIGKTINPKNRFWSHKNNSKNNSKLAIHRAIRKYGINNAIFEVIASCLHDKCANESEISMIKQYDSFGVNGYNMTIGGDGVGSGKSHPNFGKLLSEETKKKMSIAKLGEKCWIYGKHHSGDTKNKISISNLGKKHSEESKNKISIALSGENNPFFGKHLSKEHKKKMSIALSGENNPMYGKKHTVDTKKKISISNLGKLRSEETKRKISISSLGKHHSEETKNKMSIAQSGKNNPMYGRKGKNNPKFGKRLSEETKNKIKKSLSKKWKLYHSNGKISITNKLKSWCKENNYHSSLISNVFIGKQKRHKDIIKVGKIL